MVNCFRFFVPHRHQADSKVIEVNYAEKGSLTEDESKNIKWGIAPETEKKK